MIETFSALGARLLGFGDDDATRAVIDSACRANGWFTPADIRRAVRAIACDMLQREKLEAWLADYPALPVAEPRRVLVVMAGNIPLVGFRPAVRACERPRLSREALRQGFRADGTCRGAAARNRPFRAGPPVRRNVARRRRDRHRQRQRQPLFPGALRRHSLLLRGSRQSVAVLSGHETPEQLAGLADDIWAYSGLGVAACR